MTDRGLPIVDGAPACPFVAFDDDRDGRALAPDHRHRCYAEASPAPRALAHQEAYCLSSAFPVCPTFQDWARREAAALRGPAASGPAAPRVEPPQSQSLPRRDLEGRHPVGSDGSRAVPPSRPVRRDWAAPPPWVAGGDDPADDEPRSFLAARERDLGERRDTASRGLAGSPADWVAGPDRELPRPSTPEPRRPRPQPPVPDDLAKEPDGTWPVPPPARTAGRPGRPEAPAWAEAPARGDTPARPPQVSRREPPRRRHSEAEAVELFGPAWERPHRFEAYPRLRLPVGLPSLPGVALGAVALLLAGAILFFGGPMLLGLGAKPVAPTPSPTPTPTATPVPTPTPAPTPQLYAVAKGDTMSRIATKFGVTLDALLAANPKIKDPNKIKEGDQLVIPAALPTSVPDQVNSSSGP